MKELLNEKQPIGDSGAEASERLVVEDGKLKASIELSYPLDKLAKPVTDIIDQSIDKLEAAIPGDWDKAILEPIREAAHKKVADLLSEL